MKINSIIGSAFILATLTFQAQVTLACDCGPPSLKESVEESTAIFAGKVIEIAIEGNRVEVKFEVSRYWKGITTKTVSVYGWDDCAYDFEKGVEFLVYAYGKKEELETSGCTRNKELENATEDLAELGEGERPGIPRSEGRR